MIRSPALEEDLSWVQLTLNGDKEAFRHIVVKYHGMIYDLCKRMLGQAEEAEDITQETFLRAFRKLSTYQLSYKFSTWLYTVSLNVIRNHRRRRWLKRMLSLDVEHEGNAIIEPVDTRYDPEESIKSQRANALIDSMLNSLKADWKEPFFLHYIKNLSCKEVAQILGISEESVKVRLFRSRSFLERKFRSQLNDIL